MELLVKFWQGLPKFGESQENAMPMLPVSSHLTIRGPTGGQQRVDAQAFAHNPRLQKRRGLSASC